MFLEEARIAARINHPNVVQTYEVGFDGEHPYIAMEYIEGKSVDSLMRRARRKWGQAGIPLDFHLEILVNVLGGLHFAHELLDFDGRPFHVVHRDISPQNVMVTYGGHVKVLDFGIAKAADSATETRAGIMKGKYAYMAPEQCRQGTVDRRADIYSAGVMLWQAMTGRRMWRGLTSSQMLVQVAVGEIPKPREVNPSVDPELADICMKALALSPGDRYANAAEFQAALEAWRKRLASHPTAADLGQMVESLAGDSRARIRAAVEAQVRKPPSPEVTGSIPALWATGVSSPSGVRLNSSFSESIGALSAMPLPSRRSLLVFGGAVAGLLAALAVAVALARIIDPKPAPPAARVSASAPAASPSAAFVSVKVSASPPEAKLYLDDAELFSNPTTAKFVRDGATHRIRATATGYQTKSQLLAFDSDEVSAELSLDPAPRTPRPLVGGDGAARPVAPRAEASSSSAPPSPAVQPSPWTAVTALPVARTVRPIDSHNPWAPAL
jgi:serine/threonine-protein kinase